MYLQKFENESLFSSNFIYYIYRTRKSKLPLISENCPYIFCISFLNILTNYMYYYLCFMYLSMFDEGNYVVWCSV